MFRKKLTENIVFSLLVKFAVMFLAVALSVFHQKELPLGLAIFSDVGVSLLAILNSLLIMKIFKKSTKKQEVIIDE